MSAVVLLGEFMMRLSPREQQQFLETPEFRAWFGGSEANVAVSLAHLGVASRFVTRLPENPLGDAALAALRADGVDVRYVQRGGARLGLYFVESGAGLRAMRVIYDRAGSSFSEIRADSFDWKAILADADWFHVSGITPALSVGAAEATAVAIREARAHGVRTSFDLNFREALWVGRQPGPIVMPLARQCEMIIANRVALSAMLGVPVDDGGDALTIARNLCAGLGCRSVAITTREVQSAERHIWSATLYERETDTLLESRSYDMEVVDRVGGGDSFTAALIFALRDGRRAQAALDFAVAASALKLTVPGDASRVSVKEVEDFLPGRA